MKSLQEFWRDTETRDNVHEYLIQFLKEEAVRMLMNKESVLGVAEAKDYIDKAFENMDTMFQPKVRNKKQINESR